MMTNPCTDKLIWVLVAFSRNSDVKQQNKHTKYCVTKNAFMLNQFNFEVEQFFDIDTKEFHQKIS